MSVEAQATVSPAQSDLNSLFHHIWLLAGMAIGLSATLAWSSFVGYGLFRLVF
jgi:hypothetical protein